MRFLGRRICSLMCDGILGLTLLVVIFVSVFTDDDDVIDSGDIVVSTVAAVPWCVWLCGTAGPSLRDDSFGRSSILRLGGGAFAITHPHYSRRWKSVYVRGPDSHS